MVRRKRKKQKVTPSQIIITFLTAIMIVLAGGRVTGKLSHINFGTLGMAQNARSQQNTPSEKLASSVLTDSVKQQLGGSIAYNGHGAFIINNDHNDLNASIVSAPYATDEVDALGRPHIGNAWLNKTARQYQNRNQTGNGRTDWKPAGFHQLTGLPGEYKHAYDRGHLLGYALMAAFEDLILQSRIQQMLLLRQIGRAHV